MELRTDAATQLVARPGMHRGLLEPAVLILVGQRAELGVMLEAEVVATAARLEAACDGGIVAQRLVLQARRHDCVA